MVSIRAYVNNSIVNSPDRSHSDYPIFILGSGYNYQMIYKKFWVDIRSVSSCHTLYKSIYPALITPVNIIINNIITH